jgi:hypothetical protein
MIRVSLSATPPLVFKVRISASSSAASRPATRSW